MKKNAVTLAFAVIISMFSTQLFAQDNPVSFGVKAGTGFSNYRLSGDMKGFKSKMKIGGSLGGFLKYDISTNFALQSGIDVYYQTSGLKPKGSKSSDSLKYWGMEIPLYGILQTELGSGKVFIGAGPYAGFGLSSKSDGVNLFKKNKETGKAVMNRFDCGIGAIVGYDFDKNWQISASYQLGLADQYKAKGGSMKSQSIGVGIGYKF